MVANFYKQFWPRAGVANNGIDVPGREDACEGRGVRAMQNSA
jgi:hypothetical protein